MKKLLFILPFLFLACKKSSNNAPVSTQSVASQIGFQFEHAYTMTIYSNANGSSGEIITDTITFHSYDTATGYNPITEVYKGITYNYHISIDVTSIQNIPSWDSLISPKSALYCGTTIIADSGLYRQFGGSYVCKFIKGEVCRNNQPTLGMILPSTAPAYCYATFTN